VPKKQRKLKEKIGRFKHTRIPFQIEWQGGVTFRRPLTAHNHPNVNGLDIADIRRAGPNG